MIDCCFVNKTDGTGFYSSLEKFVTCIGLDLKFVSETEIYLEVYFDSETWNVEEDGLIYSDKNWLVECRNNLISLGFDSGIVKDVQYAPFRYQTEESVLLQVTPAFGDLFNKLKEEHILEHIV